MADHPSKAIVGKRGRAGLIALLVAAAGAGLGAIGGRAFRAWRVSRRRPLVVRPASSMAATELLGEDMAKKKSAAQPGESTAVYLRLNQETLERLDAFAAVQEGAPSRAEAARMLIGKALEGEVVPAAEAKDAPRFKPGDRVTTNRHGAGVVTEGPIQSIHYAITFDEPGDAPPPRVNERGLRPA